ncbi:Non-specific lipid-transfer protein-like protein [Drosera capensis]
MGSPSLVKFACAALLVMAVATPLANAAVFIFTPNPVYYCRDCMANGEQASALSWLTCCPGLKDVADKLKAPSAKTLDKQMGCVGMAQYLSELPGYKWTYSGYTTKRCNAEMPYTISVTSNCSAVK